MRIQRTKLCNLNFLAPTINTWLEQDYIYIQKVFMGSVVAERYVKTEDIEEVKASKEGFFKMLFNFGELVVKARGDVVEKIEWVKNPHYYEEILTRSRNALS